MPFDWILPVRGEEDRFAVRFGTIQSQYDGDATISCITHEIILDVSGPICIDIGADLAWWSLFCKYYNPSSHVYAFEPHPVQYALLEKYSSPSFITYNAAVSDKESTMLMEFNNCESHSRTNTGTSVKTTRLDFILNKHSSIDIIKIDTEGHEYTILMSMKEHFHKIQAIVFEFTTYWYGADKSECITRSNELLQLAWNQFPFIYLVSRRLSLKLIRITDIDNIIPIIVLLYNNRISTDILCSRRELKSLSVYNDEEFLENLYLLV